MIDTFNFSINPASAALGPISDNGCRHQQSTGPWAKPMFAIHARGWLVINVASELEKALGRTTLRKMKSAPVLLCAQLETERAVYLLRVATRVQLTLQE
jgi:hypothetical protein